MKKKRYTADEFESVEPMTPQSNPSKSTLAAFMVLVQGYTYRQAAIYENISAQAISAKVKTIELKLLRLKEAKKVEGVQRLESSQPLQQ